MQRPLNKGAFLLQAGFHEAVMLLFQLALIQVLACFAAAFAGLPFLFFPKDEVVTDVFASGFARRPVLPQHFFALHLITADGVADGGCHLAGVDGVQPCGQLFQRQAEHTPLFAVVGNRHYFSDG